MSIWGPQANAASALRKLVQWVGSYHQQEKIKGWAKTNANVNAAGIRQAYEKKLRAEQERLKYLRAAPADIIFPAIVSARPNPFHVPADAFRVYSSGAPIMIIRKKSWVGIWKHATRSAQSIHVTLPLIQCRRR